MFRPNDENSLVSEIGVLIQQPKESIWLIPVGSHVSVVVKVSPRLGTQIIDKILFPNVVGRVGPDVGLVKVLFLCAYPFSYSIQCVVWNEDIRRLNWNTWIAYIQIFVADNGITINGDLQLIG